MQSREGEASMSPEEKEIMIEEGIKKWRIVINILLIVVES